MVMSAAALWFLRCSRCRWWLRREAPTKTAQQTLKQAKVPSRFGFAFTSAISGAAARSPACGLHQLIMLNFTPF
jgi:hypothetical protein